MAKVEWQTIDGEKWFKFNSKFDYFKYYYGHIITIALFIFIIVVTIFAGYYIYYHKVAFFENPLVYGIKEIAEQNDGVGYCSCYIERQDQLLLSFQVDEEKIYPFS